MSINQKKLTKEQIKKAMQCKNADELMNLAKAEGFDITQKEAEAYLEELADCELDGEVLKKAAGGGCYADCQQVCGCDAECPYDVRGSR